MLYRKGSLSDGEEDVDSIFESLFKASESGGGGGGSGSRSHLSRVAWGSKSSKSVDMCERGRAIDFHQFKGATTPGGGGGVVADHHTSTPLVPPPSTSSSKFGGGGASNINKFKEMDAKAKAGGGGGGGAPMFKFTTPNNAKEIILYWCQCRTRDYENVKIENFSSSWNDGLAFCALIHHFFPTAFDYNSLDPKNRRHNFDLAFRTADEKAGIYPLLDTEDMMIMGRKPDWKCVFTYVQSLYRGLKDL